MAALAMLALPACAAGVATDCSVRNDAGALVATVTLANHSPKSVEESLVLVRVTSLRPPENRLFISSTPIGAWQSKTISGPVADDEKYTFKFENGGCEVETLKYTDGSFWEMPSPI